MEFEFLFSDGGRSQYFKGRTGDCVVRAICNATGKDYKEVYDAINEMAKNERTGVRKRKISNARTGVYKTTWKKYIDNNLSGFEYLVTNRIGDSNKLHLDYDEIYQFLWENGYDIKHSVCIVKVSHHLTCIKKGRLLDTGDCSRDGSRMVYGIWVKRI